MNRKMLKAFKKHFTAFRDLGFPICGLCFMEIRDNPKVVVLYPGERKEIICQECLKGLQSVVKEVKINNKRRGLND